MDDLLLTLRRYRIVPVATVETPERGPELAARLTAARLPLVEITFRTGAAASAVKLIRDAYPDMCIGAGTILTPGQAGEAMEAGADFLVAPGFNPAMVDFCQARRFPFIPGVDSPTLIEAALDRGLSLVKFFPAQASGGIDYIRAVAGPYKAIQLMPTGGITADNLAAYLAYDRIAACGASWIVPEKALSQGNFDLIQDRIDRMKKMLHEIGPPEI